MELKLKFQRLDYQKQAVESICGVFKNIPIQHSFQSEANPAFDLESTKHILTSNIEEQRASNGVDIGEVLIDDALNIDVLMETGTGKTFTYIETIYRLYKEYKLSKFIVLVPSNAIRQGAVKNLDITKEFFQKEYGKTISIFDYSDKTILNYINNSNQNISVLISTYQSFNKETNTINKNSVEKILIGKAKSYMGALAELRPVVIIDEPHRFEGKKTAEYLTKFNPLFTIRFGATFKNKEYKNLLYILDSHTAFKNGLVKSITVETIGNESIDAHTLRLTDVIGSKASDYKASISYKDIHSKNKTVKLSAGDNLGSKAEIEYLSGYVVEKITKKEVLFTNGFTLPIQEDASYGMLLDNIQNSIIEQTIETHFEREEILHKMGIKALSLFFIDSVNKYLLDDGSAGTLAKRFEELYAKKLTEILANDKLDEAYRKYLMRSKNNVSKIHKGYFAKSNKDKEQEASIKLILEDKERLLSFDTDLRFIFSMWALQEGWDNPNVFTLCKLAPSNSEISKLQQIGRGLRLAVDQEGNRITQEHEYFDFVNELNVIVPSTEGDFVESIQNEIQANSIKKFSRKIDDKLLEELGITSNTRTANKLLDLLSEYGIVNLDDETGEAELIASSNEYFASIQKIMSGANAIKGVEADKLKNYLDDYYMSKNKVKTKRKDTKQSISINQEHYSKFKLLWENLNRDAIIKYDVDTEVLISDIVAKVNENFIIKEQEIIISTHKRVEDANANEMTTKRKSVAYHSVFTIYEFIKELANGTKLSYQTIAIILQTIKPEKFAMLAKNENLALFRLKEICLNSLYEVLLNKISYEIKEIRAKKTTLTDNKGNALDSILAGSCGVEAYPIKNSVVRAKSLYGEDYMEVDSGIEKTTIDESSLDEITVFAKLPKVKIPTPNGTYNPDFGYVIKRDGKQELYMVVETKGYDDFEQIGDSEKLKIKSAEKFFQTLRDKGVNIHYETKLNNKQLADILGEIEKN
ncbi:MAG: type III restriction-modification system endonuclease [Sulfurimonas sp.]|nr:MAG: type III restriction-modification system endonuclease [Sulfurimonas sp.]